MGWDLCAGLFYEHRFAMLIMKLFKDQAILVVVDEWAAQVLIGAPGASAGRYCYLMDWVSSY